MKDFENYASQIEKTSYIRCKDNLIDYMNNKSPVRKLYLERKRDPFLRAAKSKKMKLEMMQRPTDDKPKQMYAKTGEIRLRDLSPTQRRNKHVRMKNYGRWYVEPDSFNQVLKLTPTLQYYNP